MAQRLLGGRVIGRSLGTPEAGQKGLFPSVWGVAGGPAMEGGKQDSHRCCGALLQQILSWSLAWGRWCPACFSPSSHTGSSP